MQTQIQCQKKKLNRCKFLQQCSRRLRYSKSIGISALANNIVNKKIKKILLVDKFLHCKENKYVTSDNEKTI